MQVSRKLIVFVFSGIAVALAAFHAPGQMSVDSISGLYEAMTGSASQWGPTFSSAFLAWLGGGVVGTSLFVAINCYATYGCLAAILASRSKRTTPGWQKYVAFALALNPLFMFYVGIIWKDVMLATVAMVAATCMLLAMGRKVHARYVLLSCAALMISSMVLIRQQGILLAAPFAVAAACLLARTHQRRKSTQGAVFLAALLAMTLMTMGLEKMSSETIRPQAASPVSVGFLTIRAYDIAGMIKYAAPNDDASWSGAPAEVKAAIRLHYSSRRIDTIWHESPVRGYFNTLTAKQYATIWWSGIKHDPMAYIDHRVMAFAHLLGFGSIDGCVPAYWGVAGLPEQMSALGFREEMDGRARVIGHTAMRLYGTPVFRNWIYALMLLLATVGLIFRTRGEQLWVGASIAVAAWLYLLSFVPTTIACDVRYLYPVAGLSTLLAMHLLMHSRLGRNSGKMESLS